MFSPMRGMGPNDASRLRRVNTQGADMSVIGEATIVRRPKRDRSLEPGSLPRSVWAFERILQLGEAGLAGSTL